MARDPGVDTQSTKPLAADGGEIIRALDKIVRRAAIAGASDIHLEPKPERMRIRFRLDGVMAEQPPLRSALCAPLVSRVKVLAKMDIAEKRKLQDGTFRMPIGESEVSVRVSTFPTFDGEKVVLRLLTGGAVLPVEELGMDELQAHTLRGLTSRTGGLLLVTGPTGSGKTSTLYAILSELDTRRLNVVTLEDPIEVQLPEVTQGQVHPKAGFTFANGLRAILRQDPDVILVGEMRDAETAAIAIQASLTGHLVLSTMHTNSTIATITRLLDLGLEPYVVASALVGVVAQRLVRVVCPSCASPFTLTGSVATEVGFELPANAMLAQAVGCERCHNTGFRGRRGIFEVLEVDDHLTPLIKRKANVVEFKQVLRELRVPTLRRAGIALALQGETTVPEVLRAT